MRKFFYLLLFFTIKTSVFSQSFVKIYSDLAPTYAGYNVLLDNNKQITVSGIYNGGCMSSN